MDCKYAKKIETNGISMTNGSVVSQMKQHHHTHYNQPLARPSQWQHQPFAAPPTLPIDDFYMTENPNYYGEDEKQLRIKLAAVYRLIESNGWAMGIYNHVTVSMRYSLAQHGAARARHLVLIMIPIHGHVV